MTLDILQPSRCDLGLIITDQIALPILDFVQSFLELDEHGLGKKDCSYAVHNIHLDSNGMKTYRNTINGNRNRSKPPSAKSIANL